MWFTETPWPPIVALLTGAVVFGFLWTRARNRTLGGLAVACAVLVPVVYFAEQAIVTPAEEVESLVFELRDAVVAGDAGRALDYLSESVPLEREPVAAALGRYDVDDDLRITDLSVGTVAEGSQAVSHFRANGTVRGPGADGLHVATRWKLSLRKEGGRWKVFKVERLNPINGDPIGMFSGR